MKSPGVLVKNLWFGYAQDTPVLRGVDLAAQPGSVTCIVGPTGSGKTTLLLVMAGLLSPWRGEVLIDGEALHSNPRRFRRAIGLLFQDPDTQLFNPSVEEEIGYALHTMGMDTGEIRSSVRGVAKRLGIEHLLNRAPYTLSVGEKKLVALASVLVYQPRILLLDEPVANLDASTAGVVKDVIEEEKRRGVAVVIATHDLDLVFDLGDEVYAIQNGEAVYLGSGADVYRPEVVDRLGIPQPPITRLIRSLALDYREVVEILRHGKR